ncbi:SAM-dependent methyltransferase [Streptomyces buecherae]|uniref:SAM-dependent methyltransferase n=1 Tax=Streptomyces buecherae TaxID=2763006 RepID=UPI00378DDEE0
MDQTLAEARLSQDRPHSARMYDFFLGGKTNYLVDREAAEEVISRFPAVVTAARANRAFMHRSVRHLAAECGIRQFIDVGTGIPTAPNVHEVAQAAAPDSRIVYVDNDPIVLVYAEELLDSTPSGATRYVEADATDARAVLDAVERTRCIDFTKPVALNLHALLHFVPDDRQPYVIVRDLVDRLAPGSYLSLSHVTYDFEPEAWHAVADIYTRRGTPAQVRSRAEVLRFFDGLDLIEPGLVVAHRWRPEPASGPSLVTDTEVSLYAGIGRKR